LRASISFFVIGFAASISLQRQFKARIGTQTGKRTATRAATAVRHRGPLWIRSRDEIQGRRIDAHTCERE
jgi:hypothetical protein